MAWYSGFISWDCSVGQVPTIFQAFMATGGSKLLDIFHCLGCQIMKSRSHGLGLISFLHPTQTILHVPPKENDLTYVLIGAHLHTHCLSQ